MRNAIHELHELLERHNKAELEFTGEKLHD